ncbi:MAG: hypothetical protein H6591_07430 [Flavobacteriales bacterium]|nr:hypothetical protein [Flavobacteriales bacterium]
MAVRRKRAKDHAVCFGTAGPPRDYLYFVLTDSGTGVNLMRLSVPGLSGLANMAKAGGDVRRTIHGDMLFTSTAYNRVYTLTAPDEADPLVAKASITSTAPSQRLLPHVALQPIVLSPPDHFTRAIGLRRYELTDHLGNVRVTLTDRKLSHYTASLNGSEWDETGPDEFRAEVIAKADYYPFGSLLPDRNYSSTTDTYRFGFNGMPSDEEFAGERNSYDFGARIYDPRVARWLSLDPLAKKYASESNYCYTSGNPILFVDKDGKDRTYYLKVIDKNGRGHIIAQRVEHNNEVTARVSSGYNSIHTYYAVYNVSTTITVDLRKEQGQQLSVTDDGADYSSRSTKYSQTAWGAWSSLFSEAPDLMGGGSSQSDGWRFTSEFSGEGSGVKSEHDPETTNVDLLMAAVAGITKSTDLPNLMKPLGGAKFLNVLGKLGREIDKAASGAPPEEVPNPASPNVQDTVFSDCGNLHLRDNAKDHVDPFSPPAGKSTSDYEKVP